jgi:hypothetical protein
VPKPVEDLRNDYFFSLSPCVPHPSQPPRRYCCYRYRCLALLSVVLVVRFFYFHLAQRRHTEQLSTRMLSTLLTTASKYTSYHLQSANDSVSRTDNMGFKSLFSRKAAAPPSNPDLETACSAQHTDTCKAHKRSKSDRALSGIRKALGVRQGERDAQYVNTPASPPLQPAPLYHFESTVAARQLDLEVPESSALRSAGAVPEALPSPAVATHKEEPIVSRVLSLPPTTADPTSPNTAKDSEILSTVSTSPTSPPATADSSLSPESFTDTPPSTLDFIFPKNDINAHRRANSHVGYESALEGLREAEKILEQRHASIETQDETNNTNKEKNRKLGLRTLIKKRTRSPKDGPKNTPKSSPKGNHQESPTGSPRRAKLPAHLPTPAHQQHRQPKTAQDACDALQRRRIIRHLAYTAASGCEEAAAAFEELNAHYTFRARHHDPSTIPELILNFDGIHIRASQLRTAERTWLSRFNAVRKLRSLCERKQLGQEDFEHIADQLFPSDIEHILKPEYFSIFVTGLSTEGILTSHEAKSIIALQPSVEEFEMGARWTGHAKKPQHNPNLSELLIFDIPQETQKTVSAGAKPKTLGHYLHVLIEAAVYSQQFWKGYFFANARSKLTHFHAAHLHQQKQKGQILPPHLTSYSRPWTFREQRMLERGAMLLALLSSWDSGSMTDFGIIRAMRSSFIRIPGQAYWDAEELCTFLYHRVVNSGLEISLIPKILALHHEYDTDFMRAGKRMLVEGRLRDEMVLFRKEEEERVKEIEVSQQSFEEYKMKDMGAWGRLRHNCKVWFGQKEVVQPFDPFAEED